MAVVQEAVDARSSYVLRNRMFWPDGTVRWIEAHGKVTTDDAGQPHRARSAACATSPSGSTVQEREADAAARALLLQEVTADFFRAWTLDQVEAVLAASLERLADDRAARRSSSGCPTTSRRSPTGPRSWRAPSARCPTRTLQLLDTLASQCAIAAERAKLEARTADIAEQLQSSLAASPLPALDRFDLAVHYAPGGDELEHVGGDWYDAVRTPTGTLALVVGDVMGRGVRAATTMIRVRAGIRGLLTVDPAPQAVLDRRRRDDDPRRSRPVRDRRRGARGPDHRDAHPVQRRSRARRRGPPGRPHRDVGRRFRASRSACPAASTGRWRRPTSSPGTLLVLVTDGVVESRTDDLDQGITRLRDRAVELRDRPLRELVDALADAGRHVTARRRHGRGGAAQVSGRLGTFGSCSRASASLAWGHGRVHAQQRRVRAGDGAGRPAALDRRDHHPARPLPGLGRCSSTASSGSCG